MRIGAFVISRNEDADTVKNTIASLKNQTAAVEILFIDDGNPKSTMDAVRGMLENTEIVSLPPHEESYVGRPEFAHVFNVGFSALRECDYVMVSGADVQYPPNYAENIISWMAADDAVVAGGHPKGAIPGVPRGTGRIFKMSWFRTLPVFGYPGTYGFEVYPLLIAELQSKKVKVYDIEFTMRPLAQSSKKAYLWGKGMKAMNYWWPYAFGRAFLSIKKPLICLNLIKGYLETTPKAPGLEGVPALQRRIIRNRMVGSKTR